MHFAIFCPPLAGHVRPLAVLARELESRGHRATFVHHRGAESLAELNRVAFAPVAGCAPGGGTIRNLARQTDLLCGEAPGVLARIGADAVLGDQLEPAGALVAERLGLPFATIACALPVNREPGIPPPYVGWRYDPTPRGLRRNAGGWRVTDLLMRPLGSVIQAWCERWGLPVRRRLEDCFSPRLQLAQAVAGIDFDREHLPPHFHYVGPFREAEATAIELPSRRPLVYCSLGTTHRAGGFRMFRAVAKACAEQGASLVIAHCGRLSRREIEALPGDPAVHDFVPQQAVLRRADAVVTTAGLNTVLDALAAGLPIVAMPLAFEQPATGARIEHAGVGRVVRPARPLGQRLRRGLGAVLEEPAFRERAGALRREIEAAGGVTRAADLVESRLG